LVFQFEPTELEATRSGFWFDLELDFFVLCSGWMAVLEFNQVATTQICLFVAVHSQWRTQRHLELTLFPIAPARLGFVGMFTPGSIGFGFDRVSMERFQIGVPVAGALFRLDLYCRCVELANGDFEWILKETQGLADHGRQCIPPHVGLLNDKTQGVGQGEKTTKCDKQPTDKKQCFVVYEFSNLIQCHE